MSYSTGGSPRPSTGGAAERRTGGVKAADLIPPRAIETGDRLATGFCIDLPLPPSVNRSQARLGNKSPGIAKWRRLCDGYLFADWRTLKQQAVKGEFAVGITWTAAEFGHSDWDNRIKPLMDYLQDRELIENDRLCRAAQVGFGVVPFGCRVVVLQEARHQRPL